MATKNSAPAGQMLVAGLVCALVAGFCVYALFTEPLWSAQWFAAIAGVGVFLPVVALAVVVSLPRRTRSRKPRVSTLHVAIVVFGGLALALASAAVSGYIAYTIDGIASFETRTGRVRHELPVPVFIAVMGVCSLAFGAASVLGIRELLRQRSNGERSGQRRSARQH